MDTQNFRRTIIGNYLKGIIALGLFAILYLFALNGRYERMGNGVLDKWKREFIRVGAEPLKFGEKGR